MNRSILLIGFALASCAGPAPGVQQEGPPRELAGRVAGTPARCVETYTGRSLQVSENNSHVLIYDDGRTLWANDLGQCRFGWNDILVTTPLGSQNCRGDLVRSIDRTSRIPGPACVLSDFVPYRRR